MSIAKKVTAALFLLAAACAAPAAEDIPLSVPEKADVRHEIDNLVAKFKAQHKNATLGLIEESIELSISYGAPAWNQGDHAACANFYKQTAESLTASFAKDSTPLAGVALHDLQSALDRIKGSPDVDHNAWSLRFAFDKTQLAAESESSHAAALLELGDEYLKRADFAAALDAYAAVGATLAEMDGRSLRRISIPVRFSPLATANALFGQKKYHEAATAVMRGLEAIPELPGAKIDIRTVYGDVLVYQVLLDDLKGEVERSPKDADLHFLLGYEYLFSGQKDAATELLNQTLTLDPNHAGAKHLLHPPAEPMSDHKSGPQL